MHVGYDNCMLASELISKLEILACIECTHVHGIKLGLDCICGILAQMY